MALFNTFTDVSNLFLRGDIMLMLVSFRDFEQWPYAIPASFAAFGCLFSFSVLADTLGWLRRLLVYIGKKTLPIMCLHHLGFKITFSYYTW